MGKEDHERGNVQSIQRCPSRMTTPFDAQSIKMCNINQNGVVIDVIDM